MPNYFCLTRKNDPESGPVALATIDEELCNMLGVPVHPKDFVAWWVDIIGLRLATGQSLDRIIAESKEVYASEPDNELARQHVLIAEYLNTHYTSDAWARIGRL